VSPPPIVAVTHDDDLVVVALTGEIDLANASEIEAAVLGSVPNGVRGLVLDAAELGYLDSSGVRLLLSVAGRLSWRGQGFALASPAGSRCRRVLSLAGVDGAFPIEATAPEAAARLRADVDRTDG
jgi:anti-anti-sigma factor